jgi:adenylosuccinate lyase
VSGWNLFSSTQDGSSAMPFKKNPISSTEKICSLARYMASLPQVAFRKFHPFLSRTEPLMIPPIVRIIISESFLALIDEILITAEKNLSGTYHQ